MASFLAHFHLFVITTSAPATENQNQDTTHSFTPCFFHSIYGMRILINHCNLWKSALNTSIAIHHILVLSNLCSLTSSLGLLNFSQDGLFWFCEGRSSSLQGLQACHFFLCGTTLSPSFLLHPHPVTRISTLKIFQHTPFLHIPYHNL